MKILWVRFFYRFFFTVYIAVFSAIGSDGMNSFYWAVVVGIIIDLLRFKYVPTELSGDGTWKWARFSKFSDICNFNSNIIVSASIWSVIYIWMICLAEMLLPEYITHFYFSLFEPIYHIFSSQFDFIRDQASDLILNGYEHKALLTLHIYSFGLLFVFAGIVWYACFRAHHLSPQWLPEHLIGKFDPLKEANKTIGIVVLLAFFWAGWNLLEVEFIRTRRRSINVHEGYIVFALYFNCIIIATHMFLSFSYMMVLEAYEALNDGLMGSE